MWDVLGVADEVVMDMSRSESGFTVIELAVVISMMGGVVALLALVVAVLTPFGFGAAFVVVAGLLTAAAVVNVRTARKA